MFYKNYLNKLIATFKAIDTASAIARLTIKLMALKQKQSQPSNSTNKQIKKN